MNAREKIKRCARAGAVPLGFQAHAPNAVEHEGEKADERVGPDAIGKAMINRCDLDVGFQGAIPLPISRQP